MTDIELDAIEARANAATAGPWRVYPNPMRSDGVFVGRDVPVKPYPSVWSMDGGALYPAVPDGACILYEQVSHADGAFIAAARQDMPALVAEVRLLRREVVRLEATHVEVDTHRAQMAEERVRELEEARTCVTCYGAICPPMQCGTCIEAGREAPGMPARPVTALLRGRVAQLEAALRWYASPETWAPDRLSNYNDADMDRGARARVALG